MNVKFFATAALAIVGLLPMFADRPPLITDVRVKALETSVSVLQTKVAVLETPPATVAGTPEATSGETKHFEIGGVDCKALDANDVYGSFTCKSTIANLTNSPIQVAVDYIAYDKDGFEIYRSLDNAVIEANSTITHTQNVIIQLPQARNVDSFAVEVKEY